MTESQLQSKICEYLAHKGYCFSRINNTPVYMPERKCFRKMGKYVMRGFPDIIVLIPRSSLHIGGAFVGLEIKSKKGIQSADQKLAQKKIREAGGFYFLIRSWEDFEELGL